jgi:diacylglycerol kinase (ATP)
LKLLIIFNPNAAYGRSAKKLAEIKARFKRLGITAEFIATKQPGHGTELVAKADLSGFDGLVAAGGDGTVFEVLNGLYKHPKNKRIPLGLLPIGTGNAFSRELDLNTEGWTGAMELLRQGHTRQVDTCWVKSSDKSFYYLNTIHMGFSVDAGLTAQKLKWFGQTAYTLATLWQVLKLKSYPLVLEINDEVITSNNVFITISNSRYTGTNFLIAPTAEIDDGLMDVTILENLSRGRLLRLFPTIYDGRHVDYDEVSTYKAATIKIISPDSMLLGPDGEFCGSSPAEISCLHRDLTIFSNKQVAENSIS